MRELFVFPTEIEKGGTCQLVKGSFPQAELRPLEQEQDILVALKIESLRPATFIHWAFEQTASGLHVIQYCYNLTMALTDHPMPKWLVREIMSDPYLREEVFQLRTP